MAMPKVRKPATQKRAPHPIDMRIGDRVRRRRRALGLSQKALGDALGLSFQQVQKYELATDRISASRLYEISRVLIVPVTYFYEEPAAGETANITETQPLQDRESLQLVNAYRDISDENVRRDILKLIKVLRARDKGQGKRD